MRLFFSRYAAWIVVFCILGFFFVAEVGLSATQTVETDFAQSNRSFSAVGPPTRVDGYDQKLAALRIVGEPVYVDVRVPRLARTATVTLWGGSSGPVSPAIGIEQDGAIIALTPAKEEVFEEGYMRSSVVFDLSGLKKTDGAIRFVVSLPSVATTTPFFLHRMHIVTTRPSLAEVIAALWK